MGEHCPGRLVCILLSVLMFIFSLTFNGLAVVGIAPFRYTTGDVSAMFDTQITPIGWTFNIWALIYSFLIGMNVYIVAGLCRRRNSYGYVYCSPPVLPYGFFISWCINMGLNIGWLVLWDQGDMLVALIFLIGVILTNYSMMAFSCHGLHVYGAWLNKYHKVQNGLGLYTTWTTIATLINLSIVLTYDANMTPLDAASVSYSLLTAVLFSWFILENFVIEKHMRCILTVYPVVIWALLGNLVKNFDDTSPNRNGLFIAVLLAAACVMFVTRMIVVIWRSIKHPIYEDVNPDAMQPMEVAAKQKKALR
ncbi:hypothetical protein N1851_032444 [Merluccius polli]|uniref:Uncharacterized protein n=1 Tax=Merluccius polli TaxID=89951 RepID=A0AA47NPI1_MERPO|nr:hypothetical protein N1851_032444 [Merluccius polli]